MEAFLERERRQKIEMKHTSENKGKRDDSIFAVAMAAIVNR